MAQLPGNADNAEIVEPQDLASQHRPSSTSQVMGELKKLTGIAGPLAALNYTNFLRSWVSVWCLGQLGALQLAGGALSISYTNITGYAVLGGLAAGMNPICAQAFGRGNKAMMAQTLQRTVVILIAACVLITILWLNLEEILLDLKQNPSITNIAKIYCLYSVPDLLAHSIWLPLKNYLKSQGIATPLTWCTMLAVAIHVPISFGLVFGMKLDVPGVALAQVATSFNTLFMALGYLWYTGALGDTWVHCSWDCLRSGWWPLLKLMGPSCVSLALEWWWYEIIIILAGYLDNAEVAVATTAVIIQTTMLMYALPHALASAVSTRVGQELGAGRPAGAKTAAWLGLVCAALVGVASLTWAVCVRGVWGKAYTGDAAVLALTTAVMPLVGLCELGNCPQTVGVGVLQGSARPNVAVGINVTSFYVVGTSVAVGLAFGTRLGFAGLWCGLLAAQIVNVCLVGLVVLRTDWDGETLRARALAGPSSEVDLDSNDERFEFELVIPPPFTYELVNQQINAS